MGYWPGSQHPQGASRAWGRNPTSILHVCEDWRSGGLGKQCTPSVVIGVDRRAGPNANRSRGVTLETIARPRSTRLGKQGSPLLIVNDYAGALLAHTSDRHALLLKFEPDVQIPQKESPQYEPLLRWGLPDHLVILARSTSSLPNLSCIRSRGNQHLTLPTKTL